jgi:hypothetical protein
MNPRDRFRAAAGAYLLYGVVYWIGGVYLALHGVGVRGSPAAGLGWIALGGVLVLLVPYLLGRPRPWFERWILSRRDFARILVVLMAFRAWKVGQVALRPETAAVAAPWNGMITFRLGAIVFFAVTVFALVMVARAAWRSEDPTDPRSTASSEERSRLASLPAHPRSDPGSEERSRVAPLPARPRSNPSSEERSRVAPLPAHPRSDPSSPSSLQ